MRLKNDLINFYYYYYYMNQFNNKKINEIKSYFDKNYEIGGIAEFTSNNKYKLVSSIKGPRITNGGRGSVNIPNTNMRYHTHPCMTYPVPSIEDVMAAFYKKRSNTSIIFTALGIFILRNKNFNSSSSTVYKSNGILYKYIINDVHPKIFHITNFIVHRTQIAPPIQGLNSKNKTKNIKIGELRDQFQLYLDQLRVVLDKYLEISFIPW